MPAIFIRRAARSSRTAAAITFGYFAGDIPVRLMFLIVLTNWLWIPFIMWGDWVVRKRLKGA